MKVDNGIEEMNGLERKEWDKEILGKLDILFTSQLRVKLYCIIYLSVVL